MKLTYVPLLKLQRDLYDLPRGMERFQEYLATMIDPETRDMKLPLAALNPMAKEPIPALLDEYLGLDTDGLAATLVAQVEAKLINLKNNFSVALVLADDAKGGWTNRFAAEYHVCFNNAAYYKRSWITGTLWSSEIPSEEAVRTEILAAVFRAAYIEQFGFAKTLREMLQQEGYALSNADYKSPAMSAEELSYTEEVIAPYLDSSDYPKLFACLFGDEAASSLGYSPLGLSLRAGLTLALQQAKNNLLA